jgi:hypothetical protein
MVIIRFNPGTVTSERFPRSNRSRDDEMKFRKMDFVELFRSVCLRWRGDRNLRVKKFPELPCAIEIVASVWFHQGMCTLAGILEIPLSILSALNCRFYIQ